MDDLTVTGARAAPRARLAFEDADTAAAPGDSAGRREADHAGPDDDRIDASRVHAGFGKENGTIQSLRGSVPGQYRVR